MKKLNYLLLGLAGLTLASCSQDDLQAPGQGDGNFNVTVQLPADLGTRAVDMNTGYTANDLYYAVYDAEDGSLVQQNKTVFTEAASGALKTTVSFNLAHGKSYKISFFAAAPGAATNDPTKQDDFVYTFNAEDQTMNVNYGKMTSAGTEQNDTYDCFINLLETNEIGSDQMQASVVLYRPIAQINWGTSDLDEPSIQKAYGVNGQYILSNLSTNAYNTWNLLENDVTGNTVKVEYSEDFAQPQSANGLATFPVNSSVYKYVAMQYVLAPRQSEAIYDLNLNITNGGTGNPDKTELSSDVQVSSAPVQANYQTNIYGALLTDNVVVNVEKSPGWYTPSFDPSLEYALLHGGTFTLEHDFVLDQKFKITNDLTIDLNGYTITGPGTGTSADDGMFTVDGATLNIKGEGTLETSGSYASILVWAMNNATVNIYGGTFKANAGGEIIYIGGDATGSTTGATVNIYGGTFIPTQESNGKYSLLNIYDPARNNSHMNVMGGTFYYWDPANNTAEGAGTNFVPSGYESIESTSNGSTVYKVVPAGTKIVNSSESLKDAVSSVGEGGTILIESGNYGAFPNCSNLPNDVTIECEEGTVFTGSANPNLNGGTLKGATFQSTGTTITGTVNGSFINCEFLGGFDNARWLYAGKEAYFEGCLFSGTTYGCHFDGGSNPLTFKDCTFEGFNAFGAAITLLTFDNCRFQPNGKSAYNGINCWGVTVMNNCEFTFDGKTTSEWIDAKVSLTMNDCLINGIPASSPEVADYFVTANYGNVIFN